MRCRPLCRRSESQAKSDSLSDCEETTHVWHFCNLLLIATIIRCQYFLDFGARPEIVHYPEPAHGVIPYPLRRRTELPSVPEELHESRTGTQDCALSGGCTSSGLWPTRWCSSYDAIPATSMAMCSAFTSRSGFSCCWRSATRSAESARLIAFTAWSSFAHAVIMGTQACHAAT